MIKKYIDAIFTFIRESYIELRKVNWLSRKEAVISALVVTILILVFSIYIGSIDFILAKLLSVLLGGRR
ncbi:MAG: preprotein translocase subunit SecE [Endomicrobia bacterium]|nr:preprotein translocase subunit SecE [Endomicrobiia bacterium]